MRTPRTETQRALMIAVQESGLPYSRWAKMQGLHPSAVYATLNGRSMSVAAENRVRFALSLPPIHDVQVWIDPDVQRIIRSGQRALPYRSFQVRVPLDKADALGELVERSGYGSFSKLFLALFDFNTLESILNEIRDPVHNVVNAPTSDAK